MDRFNEIMSRIKGIQKDNLESHKNGYSERNKKKNKMDSYNKEDIEKYQINELLHKLPSLEKIFEVHRKIGEGTFSSVYLGSLKSHGTLSPSERRWFAIKHLVPTAHPSRIEHELRCLQEMGGKNNVIGVELCLRHFDTIVFIMPYIPHRKFSEYMGEMDANEVREYMRALLVALRHVHSFGVIHRDVKPSNFLYDRENRRYLLVDFGLAQRICVTPPSAPTPTPPPAHRHTNKRVRDEDDSLPGAKKMALDLTTGPSKGSNLAPGPQRLPTSLQVRTLKPIITKGSSACACACAGVGGVCAECASRPTARAARAGTQGFRPPEVLLRSARQGPAVDVWACGVVLCSLLAARYPLLRAADDVSALAELTDLLGTAALRRGAAALGRRLVTSCCRPGLCLRKLCARLRGAPPPPSASCALCPTQPCLCLDPHRPAHEIDPTRSVAGFPDSAFALVARLLEPDPRRRPSADEALRHPFLVDC